MTDPRTYRRATDPAPRPVEWDRPLRYWPEALLLLLTIGLTVTAFTLRTSGSAFALIGTFLLPLGPFLGIAALVLPRGRRRPGTLVAGRSDEGHLVLRADPSVARYTLAALLAAGFAGPCFAVDTLLAGADAVLPPVWLTLLMFVATLAGLPAAWELGRGRIRGAEMTMTPGTLVVDSLTTTRTVMWPRIRQVEPLPGPGARVRVHSSAPIDRERRGSTGRGRATTVVEVPQLTETFSLGAYAGDPAVLLAILRALGSSQDAATRILAEPDPAAVAVDL